MKVCRKCDNEYKDDYSFCPKCGTPHDPKMKYAKIPGEMSHETKDVLKKIGNVLLYVLGGALIVAYLAQFKDNVIGSIFAILFGLSLFKVFYTILEEKVPKINKKLIKILRIVLPIVILIIWMICVPSTENSSSKVNNKNDNVKDVEKQETNKDEEQSENNDSENEKQNGDTNDELKEEPKEETPVVGKTVYKLNYNELGEFGKLQDYEGADDYFYYFPNGTYKVTRISGKDTYCFLWTFYKKSYQDTWGTEYDSKDKLTYNSNGQTQTLTITDDVMVYNSNNCSYEFELVK